MKLTKQDIINQAFEEIGLAGFVFDLQPQQLQGALRRLDGMMATWNNRGLRLGYPLPSTPDDSTLAQEVTVPDAAIEAMALNLAIRIAPGYGKTVAPDTKASARGAYTQLLAQSAKPIEMQLDSMSIPAGAGGKHWRNRKDPFLTPPVDRLEAGTDSLLDLE